MLQTKLEDYIYVVPNAITNNLISAILDEYIDTNEFATSQIAAGINENIRKCGSLHISSSDIINKNQAKRKELDSYLYTSASYVLQQYLEKYKIDWIVQGDSGYCLLRYTEGDFYSQHTDHYLQNPRILSCSFSLNDDYEGGEWGFFDKGITLKVPKGSAILFPSNFMYPHEIMPVTKGTRYSLITWFI